MKLKSFITKTLAVSAIATMAVNCHPDKVEDDALLAGLISSQITTLASGNCAVSLNLATLYSGAILQQAVSSTSLSGATIFTEEEFEAATGTRVEAGQTYETFAQVPYNVKYDAFIRGGGSYTAAERTADITSARGVVDVGAYFGFIAAAVSANGGNPAGITAICSSEALRAGVSSGLNAWYETYSGDEKTTLDNTLTAASTSHAALRGGISGAATCGATFTAIGARLTTAAGQAYGARQPFANGSAVLACGRIPRTSCSFAALTTANRAAAIASAERAIGAVASNNDCRKPDSGFFQRMRTGLFAGTPRGVAVYGSAASPTDLISPVSEGSTFPSNRIFAETAYPTSAALSALSANLNVAFPLTTGTVAQTAGNGTIGFYQASNINVTPVTSCESLGLQGYGPISVVPTNSAGYQARQDLTPVKEIAYAFSPENTAASAYLATRGTATVDATNDAVACNNSFRSKFAVSVAIGGGKLPSLESATSGNGGATATLTTCLYGGNAAGRTTTSTILGSSATTLAGIADCPAAARAGATTFGDTGLNTLATFPNN